MIDIISKSLEITKSNDEKVKFLKGLYKIPMTVKEGLEQVKLQRE